MKTDEEYNSFCERWTKKFEMDRKIIPFMGWFWRSVNFNSKKIPIGKTFDGSFVGVMVNNKWYYDEALMKTDEFNYFISCLDNCIDLELNKKYDEIVKKLDELYVYIQKISF